MCYDEMFQPDGVLRPHWRKFDSLMEQIGADELARRWEQANRLINENGMTYNAYGDPDNSMRPWELDAYPLLITESEWRELSEGLIQRARLLNHILADIYGPQRLLESGSLPASIVYSHPGFIRQFHGQQLRNNCYLHLYAVDLARAPDGRWWAIGDRTDAPLGVGYALENRIVVSRMFPGVIRKCFVQRLAPFFIALRQMLNELAPDRRENPRVVLLSQGPANPNYFEDAYLARYLGYTLVEGGDLAVRDDRVYLKTLGGLLPVDVIFRRLGDMNADPLELRGNASIGLAGLLQAARAGNVAVANALGSSLVESAAFIPFLRGLSQQIFDEDLKLPSVATWWCGQDKARDYVLGNLDQLVVRSAFRIDRQEPIRVGQPAGRSLSDLADLIRSDANHFVGQEPIERSTAPVWRSRPTQQPVYAALRVFLVATEDSYSVLPGGLVRVSSEPGPLDFSILAGEGSKDAWVLAKKPVRHVSLLQPAKRAIELRRSGADLPSRAADNVFWLGRRIERAEGAARLLRPVLVRLTGEDQSAGMPELHTLLHCLVAQSQLDPALCDDGQEGWIAKIEEMLPSSILDDRQPGSLRSTIREMHRGASMVRDRMSFDSWRIIHRIEQQMRDLSRRSLVELSDVLELLNRMIIDLAAFDGLVVESMTRSQAWRFLDLGQRLERSLHTISLVRTTAEHATEGEAGVLEALLEVVDSLMTYRARYLANLQWAPVLDLLLTDETNPRSLLFQLDAIADHVENLPREHIEPLRRPEQRIALSALNQVRLIDVDMLSERRKPGGTSRLDRLLDDLAERLPQLSELIGHKYLIHAGLRRQ